MNRLYRALLAAGLLAVSAPSFCQLTPPVAPPPAEQQALPPKYEFRAAWVATVGNIDWPSKKGLPTESQKLEFLRLLDMHQHNGMNALVVQVRPAADAFYPSPYEPWSEWLKNNLSDASLTLPAVNISETGKEYELSLAAPGIKKEDFKIEIDGNLITISAEQEKKIEEKEKAYTRKEYNYSSFSRCFTLPEEALKDKAEASYKDGVLKIVLPKDGKAAKAKVKSIEVK